MAEKKYKPEEVELFVAGKVIAPFGDVLVTDETLGYDYNPSIIHTFTFDGEDEALKFYNKTLSDAAYIKDEERNITYKILSLSVKDKIVKAITRMEQHGR